MEELTDKKNKTQKLVSEVLCDKGCPSNLNATHRKEQLKNEIRNKKL